MHVRKTAVLFALLVSLAATSASAAIINFASLQGNPPDTALPGALTAGTSYTQQGFAIASIGGRYDVWRLGNSNFPGTSSASTSLFEFYAGAETLITFGANKPFTLHSIDFAPLLSGGSGPFTILVTGVFPDESFITQKFTINNSPFRLQTVRFSGFTNVVAVNFIQGTNAGYFTGQETAYQFNNIVVTATWYVNGVNGYDGNDCLSVQTACKTIGHAIALASSGDSIMVAAATYNEHLTIGTSVNVLGAGASTTIVDGGGVATVVSVSAHVTLSGLTIRNGFSSTGAGIYNSGSLVVNNSTVTGNNVSACGGGIGNNGTLTINYSTISGNRASVYGGGICQIGGTLTIYNSTISGNSASNAGGGVINQTGGTLTINNSTISGNSASHAGGGVINQTGGTLTISNGTLSGNNAPLGGGIDNTGTATLQNSIVANNSGGNCSGSITSKGYNVDSDSTCNFHNSGDQNTDPKLGTLGSYGGPTQTIPLLSGSPAIDAGNQSGCADAKGHLLKTDQRGYPRPDKEDTGGCDVGAYEKQSD